MAEPSERNHWLWDPSLYTGSAAFYVRGRVPYPAALADVLVDELDLDGRGRLLDLGCGPGSLTLLLAPYFDQVIGVDPDEQMLIEGRREAEAAGITNVSWLRARAEELSSPWARSGWPRWRSHSTGWTVIGSPICCVRS